MSSLEQLRTALADRYTLERELGAGGMATVYLAHDIKHDRKVAIKVLRPELAAVIGAERFLSEIRTTANLQHPHILPLFDSGTVMVGTDQGDPAALATLGGGGAQPTTHLYYVMPYIAGESLRDRITREHQLPVADVVRLATEIAGALDYAHRQGVIHRDIKPENVMLHDGRALVADFGIALAMANTAGTRMTETGMSLGTPHYMSPEQAMGEREITGRSDVYALGAITYEMLCGEPPFNGPTAQAIIARVMTEEPRGLTSQRKSIPPGVEAAVFTALEKLPADRFATAAEFAVALKEERTATRYTSAITSPARSRRSTVLISAIGAIALLGAAAMGRMLAPSGGGTPALVRASLELGDSIAIRPIGNVRLALSPSGGRVAFIGPDGSDVGLWVRDLDDPKPRLIPDTRGAFAPFFSPDGETIGFFAGGGAQASLKVVAATAGVIRTLVQDSVASFGGADWGDDGQIYFTHANRGLARVSAVGGAVTTISRPDSLNAIKEHDYPDVLPGSRRALVMLWKGSAGSNAVGVVDLQTGAVTELAAGSYSRYLAPGYLVIGATDGRLLAARFDAGSGTLQSTPTLILQGVQEEFSNGTTAFAVADNGTLIYQAGQTGTTGIVWVDRTGRKTLVDSSLSAAVSGVALSPDATQIALSQSVSGGSEIWVKQLTTGTFSRLSMETQNSDRPVWAPDGRQVAFLATRGPRRSPWIRRADGSDNATSVVAGSGEFDEILFERSGRFTILRSQGTNVGSRYLLVMERGVDTLPRILLQSRFDHFAPTLSPDGRWLAYVSDESGAKEVYVRPFPAVDSAKIAISVGGGLEPLWSRDGTELFFRNTRGDMFTVPVATGPRFEHRSPQLLFTDPALVQQEFYRSYDVHPDGKRFLMLQSGGGESNSINIILNWRTELDRLAGGT